MSITIITGTPGAGKSFWAVYALLRKGMLEKYYVWHNLEGLKQELMGPHIKRWTDYVEEGGEQEFFSVENQKELVEQVKKGTQTDDRPEGKPILMIVDEAQNYFDTVNGEVKKWLTWHRHIGMDVWLLTQDRNNIARQYRNLAEVEVTGNKNHVIDTFIYSHKVGKTQFRIEKLKKDAAIFRMYKSFEHTGAEKKGSHLMHYMVASVLIGVALMVYGLAYAMPHMWGKKGPGPVASVHEPRVKPEHHVKQSKHIKQTRPVKVKKEDQFAEYTLAAYLGNRIKLQDKAGNIVDGASVVPGLTILDYSSDEGAAVVMLPDGAIQKVSKKHGFVKIVSSEAGHGGRGGVTKEPSPMPGATDANIDDP
jgi:hypothetical protein